MRSSLTPRVAQVLAGAMLVAVLGGCAGTGPVAGEMRDRVTASDESPEERRARVRFELAAAYFAKGQLTTALDEVKLSLAAAPSFVQALNLRGLIYSAMGDNELAQESFERALQVAPRDGDVLHNLGWHLCRLQRWNDAEARFNQALAAPAYRDAPRTLLALGVCQARAGQLQQAQISLNRAQAFDPDSPAVAINLAEVLLRLGDSERARFQIQRVLAVPERVSAETLWLAIRIEHRLGNRAALEAAGAQLVSRFPQSAEARAFQQGRFE
jgi:type IV pilus assembly protein PilF